MSFLEGFMWLNDAEVFNNGRTQRNIETARAAGLLPNFITNGMSDCDCPAYFLNPTIEMGPFDTLLACLAWGFDIGLPCDDLGAATLNSISEENPWHDDSIFASDEFLGVWVWKVEGLDGKHNARATSPRMSFPRGSSLGPLQPTHRTITYEFALIATSTCGLDYGMEWLEAVFAARCDSCQVDEMFVRSCCPPEDEPEYGLWLLKQVGLAEGPSWSDPLDSRMAKYMRDGVVSFYAGNPCRFSKPEVCLNFTPLWSSAPTGYDQFVIGETYGALADVCCTAPNPTKIYEYSPIITIRASEAADSLPFSVKAYDNLPVDWACDNAGELPGGDVILEINVLSLPAGHTLILDGSERKILFYGPETDFEQIDGSAYVDATAGFVLWGNICGNGTAIKARVDDDVLTDAIGEWFLSSGPNYARPYIQIELVKRGGC